MNNAIKAFRQRVHDSSNESASEQLNHNINAFSAELDNKFRKKFSNLDPVLYRNTDEWLCLIGTSDGGQKTITPNELVVRWTRKLIDNFLHKQSQILDIEYERLVA